MDRNMLEVIDSLRTFIELSQQNEERPWDQWISATVKSIEVNCWEKQKCVKEGCPAFMNSCGRCWLIAGTMCGECAEGDFALKYRSCMKCDVFQGAVYKDPSTELRELLIILIYSFRTKHNALQNAMENMRVLRGLLPICASCKKVRNDTGYWEQIEIYVRRNSEAEFSHGLCPECGEKAMDELDEYRMKKH